MSNTFSTKISNALGTAGEVIRIVVEPETLVIIGGTATGSVTQRVTVLGNEGDKWVLSGENSVLTVEGSEEQCLTFSPGDKKASFILLFESGMRGSDFNDAEVAPDYKANKHVVDGFATYYTSFHEHLEVELEVLVPCRADGDEADGGRSTDKDLVPRLAGDCKRRDHLDAGGGASLVLPQAEAATESIVSDATPQTG
ncbi:hypothetical protein B0H11DRAFT_2246521 [Mycena galericulata]|nr:hypothetical protein B0H11DRAFT_2246521 [Mycena galericulata]